jgi:hypothetical protein
MIMFLGFTKIDSSFSSGGQNTTFRLTCEYGSHLSMITAWGFDGNGAKRSIITFRGGGGSFLPIK